MPKTKNDNKHRLSNGAIYRVDGFTNGGDIRLENGWVIDKDAGHLSHGYVTTSHASQGKTRDVVFVSQSSESFPASSMSQFYVSVSRAKEATIILTDDKNALRNQAILRSSQRMASTELAAKSSDFQAAAEAERASRQRSFFQRLSTAGKRAREIARYKAEQVKASMERMRNQWKDRRDDRGMSHEH